MLKLNLKNEHYQYLLLGFKEWLDIFGYTQATIYTVPNIIQEFLHYLENNGVQNISFLQHKNLLGYYDYINTRHNQRRGGGLSNNYINKHLQAVEKFLEYLRYRNVPNLPTLNIRLQKLNKHHPEILTVAEIKELFTLCNRDTTNYKQEFLQARDRAMLVVYYSCGLRRSEGINVSIDHINFDTGILHVKRGKNYKERFVPINKTNLEYLKIWLYDYRNTVVRTKQEHRLFINLKGEPTTGAVLYTRLKLLQQQSENTTLQNKIIGLHTLRHSIATHLLHAGMPLEKIARFLGHSSLESTQIYTHL